MAQVPAGTAFAIASVYAAAKTVTAVTNAAEASFSVTTHGYAVGDILEVSSGWGRLNLRHFRVKSQTTDAFVLEGCDTSNLLLFPAGGGIGSVRKVTTFAPISNVLDMSMSGGEPRPVAFRYIDADYDGTVNDGFTPVTETMQLDGDSIASAGYLALKALSAAGANSCLRKTLRNGSIVLQPCQVAISEILMMQNGNVNRVPVTFNGNAQPTRY